MFCVQKASTIFKRIEDGKCGQFFLVVFRLKSRFRSRVVKIFNFYFESEFFKIEISNPLFDTDSLLIFTKQGLMKLGPIIIELRKTPIFQISSRSVDKLCEPIERFHLNLTRLQTSLNNNIQWLTLALVLVEEPFELTENEKMNRIWTEQS